MLMLAALGVMSVTWMSVIAVATPAQKLLPAKAVIDVSLAVAIVGFGIWIVLAPSSVPGLSHRREISSVARAMEARRKGVRAVTDHKTDIAKSGSRPGWSCSRPRRS